MRLITLGAVLVLAAGAASGGEDPGKPLRGKWTLDKALMAESMPGYAAATKEQQKELRDKLATGMPDATIEFTEKQMTFGFAPNPPETATYRVVGSKDKRLELEIVSKDAEGKDKVDQTTAELVGPDVLRLTRPDVPLTMVLRRAK
jgi:hypothetical protein